jgi:kinesin family protein 4/21/27
MLPPQMLLEARQAEQRAGRPLHVCVTLQLVGQTAAGQALQTSLTFVELVAPDARDQLGRPTTPDPALSRAVSLGYSSLTAVVAAMRGARGKTGAAAPRVPWRDTPLTRWLQHPLSKAREVMVLATVSPSPHVRNTPYAYGPVELSAIVIHSFPIPS